MLDLPDFLTRDKHGSVDLKGHRIGLYHVVLFHRRGESAEQIVDRYSTLEIELVEKVLDYYRVHHDEVDAYMAEYQAELDRQREAHRGPSFDEVRARLRARSAERT